MICSFDDIQCEEDTGYLAYQAELEYQQWLEEQEIERVNQELAIISQKEFELNAVDF